MRESSLFNFFQQRINEAGIQLNYNISTLTKAYRTDGLNQRDKETIQYRIECNTTKVRLSGSETNIPSNIERCK